MNQEILRQAEDKPCQNCKINFTIEPEDFAFYEKMKVPPPTFCPECRLQRRWAWRTEVSFHRRKCDKCGKDIIATYAADTYFPVYCNTCWWADDWDATEYGQEYDFSRPFFEQFYELQKKVPAIALQVANSVNCDYTNQVVDCKNCYLLTSAGWDEDCYYSYRIVKSKGVFDSSRLLQCQNVYGCIEGLNMSYGAFTQDCADSLDVSFCYDVRGSQNCFMSSNLRRVSYMFRNQPLSKEEYKKAMQEIDLGSHRNILACKKEFKNLYRSSLHAYAGMKNTVNATGHILTNAKNCRSCFCSSELENCSYCLYLDGGKDSMDITIGEVELGYEISTGGVKSSNIKLSSDVWPEVHNLTYCASCRNGSSDLFGCIGLKKAQYCILNRQYSKEEYEALVPRIIAHMNEMPYTDTRGRTYGYGEFFPIELSHVPYNESPAQDYFPLTQVEAENEGYSWRTEDQRNAQVTKKAEDLPDHIRDTNDSILTEVIECEHMGMCRERCTIGFRIIPAELKFHRERNIALPRLCPNCRNYERFGHQNPVNLWHRTCMCRGKARDMSGKSGYGNKNTHFHGDSPCLNEFETSYPPRPASERVEAGAPDRKETVYCKECYQAEVV